MLIARALPIITYMGPSCGSDFRQAEREAPPAILQRYVDTKSYIPKGGRVYFCIKKPGFDIIFNMHYNLTVLLKIYILCNLAGNMEINIFRNHGFSAESEIMTEKEIKFLHANFSDVRFSDGYCFATYKGREDTFNDRLEKFIFISSTSYSSREAREGQKSQEILTKH